mmetsp:Transcript_111926/g.311585  ORF Transcript_111926/g.311585 Transcript_111926/m.311585 type:complete len:210 (+) Transcript_111926:716-1345(+)
MALTEWSLARAQGVEPGPSAELQLLDVASVASRPLSRRSSNSNSGSSNSRHNLVDGAGPRLVGLPLTRHGGSGLPGTAGLQKLEVVAADGSTTAATNSKATGPLVRLQPRIKAREGKRAPVLCRLHSATSVGVLMPRTPTSTLMPLHVKFMMKALCGRSAGFPHLQCVSPKARFILSFTSVAQYQRSCCRSDFEMTRTAHLSAALGPWP